MKTSHNSHKTGISKAGSILATLNVFSRTKLMPTQKISALPTKDSSSMSVWLITAPNKAAIRVIAPW